MHHCTLHENAYSSIYIFKIFSGGDTPGPPLTRGGEGTGGGEGSGAEGRGRAGERRGGREGKEGRGKEGGRGGEGRGGEEGTGRGVPILLFLQIEHWPPGYVVAAIYSFALWAWPGFLTNSSAPVHLIKKWLRGNRLHNTCSIELTAFGRAEVSRLDAGKRDLFLSAFFVIRFRLLLPRSV
jgi:hypothetical protein